MNPTIAYAPAGTRVELVLDHGETEAEATIHATVTNVTANTVALDEVRVLVDIRPQIALEVSWSGGSSRRTDIADVRPVRKDASLWWRDIVAVDDRALGEVIYGEPYLVTDAGTVGFLDGRTHFGSVQIHDQQVVAIALLDGVPLESGQSRTLSPIFVSTDPAGRAYSRLATEWGKTQNARLGATPLLSWCSWYTFGRAVSEEAVLANIPLAAQHGFDVVQIDEGYEAKIGEWLETTDRFPHGLRPVVDAIRDANMRAGIWVAPFMVDATSHLVTEHPDWFVKDPDGNPVVGFPFDMFGEPALSLDTTHPEVIAHIQDDFRTLRSWGIDYFKVDFGFAGTVRGTRYDQTLTRAEAVWAGMTAIRHAVGEDAFILGCGTPFGSVIGVVDAMRVGPDVAARWEFGEAPPGWDVRGFEDWGPSAENSIASGVLRTPLHRRVFHIDSDSILLRPTQTDLTAPERKVLAAAVAGTGAFVVDGDDLQLYGEEEWQLFADVLAVAGLSDLPLDIVDPFAMPVVVTSPNHELHVDWTPTASAPHPAGKPLIGWWPQEPGPRAVVVETNGGPVHG